tara:strand:- start:3487 stop:3744 length:258 start_codon:yes stop_codon:yes gene_type:complete
MDISILDFTLINLLSYLFGVGTGLIICCKNKDKFLVKSRSLDNISSQLYKTNQQVNPSATVVASAPSANIVPAHPAPQVTKITLE